jgi:hypothetical protein
VTRRLRVCAVTPESAASAASQQTDAASRTNDFLFIKTAACFKSEIVVRRSGRDRGDVTRELNIKARAGSAKMIRALLSSFLILPIRAQAQEAGCRRRRKQQRSAQSSALKAGLGFLSR